ncbi:SusC/RagA family TonB-linked outer membrane protein [Phocaeicola coprocola]|uniref:SusC/RagA family TonB-linked outer membrane protein n=1 Tax=Phocaeicola coprocola TaxID=310298 RepID=UPI003993BA52
MNKHAKRTVLVAGTCLSVMVAGFPGTLSASTGTMIAAQQTKSISGTIVDSNGIPVIGANVLVKGTTNGTITDIDGNFTLTVPAGAILQISFIGYNSQEVTVGEQTSFNVVLKEDTETLEEVVVVGYGVQKKKLVTGATVEVKGDDVAKRNTISALGALQNQSPGVNIQATSGKPGDGYKISIRGAGTNSSTNPLYIIDGVAGGDINALNPADIERIDVLKDAASCAIYGARAANGVIMVTTKQGKAGKVTVTYDANVGWQNVYKKPDLLNAKEYMAVQDQVAYNNGGNPYDWSKYIDADLLADYQSGANEGTNWLDQIINDNAITTSHALNISGGSELSKFSTGFGYQYQDGVIGNIAKSDYRRFTFRLNSEHIIYKTDDRDVIKFGQNLYYQHAQTQGIQIGNQYSNAISTMLRANPCVPVYNANGDYFMYDDLKNSGTDGWFAYNSYTSNPVAEIVNTQSGNNKSKNFNLNAVAYFEVQPIKNLTYRSQAYYKQYSSLWKGYTGEYKINDQGNAADQSTLSENMTIGWNWGVTNTLNYKFDLPKEHHFDVLVGTEYSREGNNMAETLEAMAKGNVFTDFSHAYFDNFTGRTGLATVGGYPVDDHSILSYFGRVNYDYKERYMFTAIMRGDGSSNFADGHRWGYFPSFSAGWVISNEQFMQSTTNWLDFLKLRVSWGQNGNENIGAFQYLATYSFGDLGQYPFGSDKNSATQGGYPTRLSNNDLTWETSEQTNIGVDTRFLGGKLSFTFDWYSKKTKDLLINVPVSSINGFTTKAANAGSIENKGIEISLGWNDSVGDDFTYGANFNLSHNKNEVIEVNNGSGYVEGGNDNLSQNTGFMARMKEGHPIGYFYGYKTDGVMQNMDDVQAYLNQNCGGNVANSLQGTSIKPGDLKFVDVNGDGVINSDDKTDLGNPHPDITMGLNLNAAYKGFDLSISAYGAFGQQVARSYRKFTDGQYENYTTEVYDYWHGEGTSDRYPLLTPGNAGPNWQNISDIYVEDADYVRLQNLTIGYDVKRVWKTCPLQQLRVYFTAQNLFTITGYKGMDPENGMALNSNEPWVTGVDVGNYPQPRTYMFGVNVKF